jgi:hypothetical protein
MRRSGSVSRASRERNPWNGLPATARAPRLRATRERSALIAVALSALIRVPPGPSPPFPSPGDARHITPAILLRRPPGALPPPVPGRVSGSCDRRLGQVDRGCLKRFAAKDASVVTAVRWIASVQAVANVASRVHRSDRRWRPSPRTTAASRRTSLPPGRDVASDAADAPSHRVALASPLPSPWHSSVARRRRSASTSARG